MSETKQRSIEISDQLPWKPHSPGEFIQVDILDGHNLTQGQLAERLHVSRRSINQLLNGKRQITTDMARRLSKLTGQSAEYWLRLQIQFDLFDTKVEATHLLIEPIRKRL